MTAMPSVSENLPVYENREDFLLALTFQQLAPSAQTSTSTYILFRELQFMVLRSGNKYTLTEWEKRVLRPVSKESLWHELVWFLPIPCYEPYENLSP